MGQYYHPAKIKLRPKTVVEHLYSHDYDSGLKLMEHSWLKNDFVNTVCKLMMKGGSWHKQRIIWAGDYGDDIRKGITWYDLAVDENKVRPIFHNLRAPKYIYNDTKKEYVDTTDLPDSEGWIVHPLPLLTAYGNGRGGGDFREENDFVGRWATHKLYCSNELVTGYTEIKPNFIEN